jgi:hypothetical protein
VSPRIFYRVADHAAPSWGQGLLYHHVRLLRHEGFDAWVLHRQRPFRLPWLDLEVPIAWESDGTPVPAPDDLLVVPEVTAGETVPWPCRRGVFVQGSFLILAPHPQAIRYPELGFEFGLAVLPHVARVMSRHFGLTPHVVPPFVAPYFLRSAEEIRATPRHRRVLLAAKPEYRRAGFPDYDIVTRLLARAFAERGRGWELEELVGLDHRQAAARMADAAFLVNLNSHEAFNTTVPEAMGSGCLPVCYEAVGGRDFLRDGADSFVFPNHHAYELVERLLDLVETADREPERLLPIRLAARESAGRFHEEATRAALVAAFAGITANPAAAAR